MVVPQGDPREGKSDESSSPCIGKGRRVITMVTELTKDRVLVRYRKALDAMYGNRIERVVLFGSRARGDAHPGSDYDLAVFLRDMEDRGTEMDRLADLRRPANALPRPTTCLSDGLTKPGAKRISQACMLCRR